MNPNEDLPPIRPRVEQLGEKVAAVILIVIVMGGLLFALNQNRLLNLAFMEQTLPILLEAAKLTISITVLAYAVGMGVGFLFGWMRTSKRRVLQSVAAGWIEAIRGTPLFVQLLFLFALLSFYTPTLAFRLLITGFLALMLNTSAYQAEIFRGGLQSVAAGQIEAAKSIGLGYWGAMRSVILPQAVRLVVPPLTNEFIALLKASSLLFVIGIAELTYQGRILSFGGNTIEVYTMMILIYLSMTVPLARAVTWLEQRYRIPGLGFQQERAPGRRRRGTSATLRVIGVDVESLRRVAFRSRDGDERTTAKFAKPDMPRPLPRSSRTS